MITWTKIDIGDGGAIWYSDCLEDEIYLNRFQDDNFFCFRTLFDDARSNALNFFYNLSSAKQWCEEHKKNHSQTKSDITEINNELREEFKKI